MIILNLILVQYFNINVIGVLYLIFNWKQASDDILAIYENMIKYFTHDYIVIITIIVNGKF